MEKRNVEDMENYLDSLEDLIKKERAMRKRKASTAENLQVLREDLQKFIQIQLEGAKEYVSKLQDQDKKKEYEDRIEHLKKLFYGKNEEDEESNCLPCYG